EGPPDPFRDLRVQIHADDAADVVLPEDVRVRFHETPSPCPIARSRDLRKGACGSRQRQASSMPSRQAATYEGPTRCASALIASTRVSPHRARRLSGP